MSAEARPPARELELEGDALRALLASASEHIVRHIGSLGERPAADTDDGAALARALATPVAPETGGSWQDLLALLFDRVITKGFGTAGPGYLAYIPGGGLPQAAVAELVAAATNRYVGVFAAAPGLAQLEADAVRWLCTFVGYPAAARGIFTTGGSLANFSAVVTAREALLGEDLTRGVVYASDQTHHSVEKAARLAGIPPARVRSIATDARFRIELSALERAIATDRKAGLQPFLVVGNAGTTSTGAVDDLAGLSELTTRERIWLHVDGAYGGFFHLTERGRRALAGLARADSITLDPHKGMFLPYGTGALVVRDGEALRRAHAGTGVYLPPVPEDDDLIDFSQYGPELSRDWRGLRVWLPVMMHGVGAFRRALDEKLDLARWATEALRATPGIEILAEPQLSCVAFGVSRPGLDLSATNALNRALLARVNQRNRVHLTATDLRGRFAIRICVLSFRTHADRVEMAIEDLREGLATL